MDENLSERINELVDEEHQLMRKASPGQPLNEADEARLRHLEVQLDQCWDLLRQRRALREFGLDPDGATARRGDTVEHYQQ